MTDTATTDPIVNPCGCNSPDGTHELGDQAFCCKGNPPDELERLRAQMGAALALLDDMLWPWATGRETYPGYRAVDARVEASEVARWRERREALESHALWPDVLCVDCTDPNPHTVSGCVVTAGKGGTRAT